MNNMSNSVVEATSTSSLALVVAKEVPLNSVSLQNRDTSTQVDAASNPFVDLSPVYVVDMHLQDPPAIETYDELFEFGCIEPGLQWELEDDYGFNLEALCAREFSEAVVNVNPHIQEPTHDTQPENEYEEEEVRGYASDGEPFVYNR